MYYYQFNISDYIAATAHLTLEEDATYRRLIDLYYLTQSVFENNPTALARKVRSTPELVESVLNEFFDLDENGCWRHSRCDAELQKYAQVVDRNRENGRRGGRKKKTESVPSGNPVVTQSEPSGFILGSQTEPKQNPNRKPITSEPVNQVNQSTPPLPPLAGEGELESEGHAPYSESFERFWTAYPKKTGKLAAWRAWQKLKCGRIADEIIEAVGAQKRTDQWNRDGGQYIPHPATWLNRASWDDEVGVPIVSAASDLMRAL